MCDCLRSVCLGGVVCITGCNAERVRNKFAFHPPRSSYELEPTTIPNPTRLKYTCEELRLDLFSRRAAEVAEVYWLTTSRDGLIPIVWIRAQSILRPPSTAQGNRPSDAGTWFERAGDAARIMITPRVMLLVVSILCKAWSVSATTAALAALCIAACVVFALCVAVRAAHPQTPQPVFHPSPKLVILHCHGNATDIGHMMSLYYELAWSLNVDVVGMEYSGYGASTGAQRPAPSEANTYADVKAAYDFIRRQGVPAHHIIVYGQSIGTGPATHLAATRELGGLVLHSPFLSAIRVADAKQDGCCNPSKLFSCVDFFENHKKIKHVKCLTLIMHGKSDKVVPFYHAEALKEACPPDMRGGVYFPTSAGHDDLIEADPVRYYQALNEFKQSVTSRC